jgi:hypothetical protein
MVFKDRKTAQTAADLLRTYFKIYPTTPYHKSLRAAITQAINKAKEANPGNHAKVNVDLNGKTLKCFIREDTNPPGKWNALDIRVPIPLPALDPGLRDISKVILPTSPNDPSLISTGLSKTRASDNRAKPTFENNQESMDTGDTSSEADANGVPLVSASNLQKNLEKVNAELSPLPAFMNTPKAKNKGNLPPVRSSLTLRSPPQAPATSWCRRSPSTVRPLFFVQSMAQTMYIRNFSTLLSAASWQWATTPLSWAATGTVQLVVRTAH